MIIILVIIEAFVCWCRQYYTMHFGGSKYRNVFSVSCSLYLCFHSLFCVISV